MKYTFECIHSVFQDYNKEVSFLHIHMYVALQFKAWFPDVDVIFYIRLEREQF